jgi:hypothetical protein
MADEASGPERGNEVQPPGELRAWHGEVRAWHGELRAWHEDRDRVAGAPQAAGRGRLTAGEPGQRRPGLYPPAS